MRILVDNQKLVSKYLKRGRPDLAWEVLRLQSQEEFESDSTSSYTVNSAERDLECGRLAFEAKAYEWAWVGAADCLAVLEWKDQCKTHTGAEARRLIREAEKNLDPGRVEDLREKHERYKAAHNYIDEVRFKEGIKRTEPLLWRRIVTDLRHPSLSDRPL